MKTFISRNTLNKILSIIKRDLSHKVDYTNELSEDDVRQLWNNVTGDQIPNILSLQHNHDELYYTREEVLQLLEYQKQQQNDPSISGSLAQKIKTLNGSYFISKVLEDNFICNQEKWTAIDPFTIRVPQKSIVCMTITFSYKQNSDGRLEMFFANSFYATDHLNNKDTRVQATRMFIAEKDQSLEVHVGSKSAFTTTILGNRDSRYSHVDYLIFPLE